MLKPCPICGGVGYHFVHRAECCGRVEIACSMCGYSTDAKLTLGAAKRQWNKEYREVQKRGKIKL